LDALLKSGVGKPVHKLLTSTDREVKSLSTKLVAKWKGLIAAKDKEKTPPVTPRPDYSKMLSPALRRELRKFGLKVIPRGKALPLLNHIYDQTHPQASSKMKETAAENKKDKSEDVDETISCSQGSQSSINEEDGHEVPEESLCVYEYEATQSSQVPSTQQKSKRQAEGGNSTGDLHADVITFIQSDPEVHRQCLTYDPLWLEPFFDNFKTWAGLTSRQVKVTQVMDVLDNECITFRTESRHKRNQKTRKEKRV